MSNLFAAVDEQDRICFVGDVPRGLACGCYCPTCRSPLVAKQGRLNEWHFAHEAGQERPECMVGALNLLRRLAIEATMQRPPLALPDYRKVVQLPGIGGMLQSTVSWPVVLDPASWAWSPEAGHGVPVGRAVVEPGIALSLYIDIGVEAATLEWEGPRESAAVLLSVASPNTTVELRTRESAMSYIQSSSRMVWLHMPDVLGMQAAAMEELRRRDQDERERHKLAMDAQARMAGQRWARIRDTMADAAAQAAFGSLGHVHDHIGPNATGEHARKPEPKPATYPWAPEAKPNASYIFFRLKDGSAWVVYPRDAGGTGIAPWGAAEDIVGWEEALPPSVGQADAAAGLYRADDAVAAIMFFNRQLWASRSSTNPDDFAGL